MKNIGIYLKIFLYLNNERIININFTPIYKYNLSGKNPYSLISFDLEKRDIEIDSESLFFPYAHPFNNILKIHN